MPRFGTFGRVPAPFLLRSYGELVATSSEFTELVKDYVNISAIVYDCFRQIMNGASP